MKIAKFFLVLSFVFLYGSSMGFGVLIAHYQFEGNALDSSGNNFDGIIEGSGTTYIPGKFGQAISFDGNGWVRVPDAPGLDLGTGDFTIALWVSFSNHSGEQVLIEKCKGTCANAYWTISTFEAGGNSRKLHFNGGFPRKTSSPQDFGINEFHHIAWTRSGTTWTTYFDGINIMTHTYSGDLSAPNISLYMGRRNPWDGRNFNLKGSLDDVRIYNHALSESEIQSLINIPEPANFLLVFGILFLFLWKRKKSDFRAY